MNSKQDIFLKVICSNCGSANYFVDIPPEDERTCDECGADIYLLSATIVEE